MRRRGNILVLTLTVIVALVSMVLVFARFIRVESLATANFEAAAQARAVAQGAAQAALAAAQAPPEAAAPLNAPDQAVEIGGGVYWLLRPDFDDEGQTYHWGLIDESARLNINSASVEVLMRLPGVTPEMAAAVVDWRDADDEPGGFGAESGYYLMAEEPYLAKNAPFESVEELLLVRGFTPQVLYGEDLNRNGVLDPNENDGDKSLPPDNADGRLDPGLIDLVTVWGGRPASSGERINVNQQGRSSQLRDRLTEAFAQTLAQDRAGALASAIVDNRPHRNLIDTFYKAQMTIDEFARVADGLTTGREAPALINVNTAPRLVLLTLPELTEADVDLLLNYRADQGGPNWGTTGGQATSGGGTAPEPLDGIAWITQVLDQDKAIAIGGMITTRSAQFTADIVAVAPNGRAFERYRATYDMTDIPRTVAWRRLTHLGWPLEPQLLRDLQSGRPVSELTPISDGGVPR